jgi:peptidoglycan/xylan/chitin deacetylase (PgdA/CDA1 family)
MLERGRVAVAIFAVGVLSTLVPMPALATAAPVVSVTSPSYRATGGAVVSASVRASIKKCYNTSQNVWLTFDDGYTSQANLSSILNTLRANNVRGRFFLVGSWARANPSMVRQIRAAGHYLENHTNTHRSLDRISDAAVSWEIAYGQQANTSPKLLRPPYGDGVYTTRLYYLALRQGYRLCQWGTDTRDWAGTSAPAIVNKVVYGDRLTPPARAGSTVLMHLKNTQTRYALPTIIKELRAKGLTFEKLS